jgi:hypothetical protein
MTPHVELAVLPATRQSKHATATEGGASLALSHVYWPLAVELKQLFQIELTSVEVHAPGLPVGAL